MFENGKNGDFGVYGRDCVLKIKKSFYINIPRKFPI